MRIDYEGEVGGPRIIEEEEQKGQTVIRLGLP